MSNGTKIGVIKAISLCSVSWIDKRGLPPITVGFALAGLGSWTNRVIIGLVGTSNPEPPQNLSDLVFFRQRKQYRALIALSLEQQPALRISNSKTIIDPGYTPPIDKSKIGAIAHLMPLGNDPIWYPGEKSSLSCVVSGKLHAYTTLTVPKNHIVLASAFIKFRAGAATDKVGIEDAGSPFHVPWVWCEYALLSSPTGYRLIARGSSFPSHAWYVNGKQVAKVYQQPVKPLPSDPALSMGRPARLSRTAAGSDKNAGAVNKHPTAVPMGKQHSVDVTRYVT